MAALPAFVPPMLAKLRRRAFDSDAHLFEPKWDGYRAQVHVTAGAWRARSRNDKDLATAFPELESVRGLPDGTILDGELVVLRGGRPDFEAMQRRGQSRDPRRAARLAAELPATFVAFDLIYDVGEPLLDEPLHARRARLAALLEDLDLPRLALSEGVVGAGSTLYERAVELGFEGVVAKRLDGPYLPGQRSDLWTKVKAEQRRACVVLGFLRDDGGGLKSLIVGTDVDGVLRYVGRVGSGFSEADRERVLRLCEERPSDAPLVDCGREGEWVAPGLYCAVRFLELTSTGTLRAPVFEGIVEEE